jgi:DNA modification methylase
MASEIVWDQLPEGGSCLRVLDPMSGSGTTLIAARLRGHRAIGYDSDHLSVLIARAWVANITGNEIKKKATQVVRRARKIVRKLPLRDAYPQGADRETKEFVRYWFDTTNRKHLAALSKSIARIRTPSIRDLMWCALSRLIITKQSGVSLAMDVSHSRPHKMYDIAPIIALRRFEKEVDRITSACPFTRETQNPLALVKVGDARSLPLANDSIDIVITSPPYLNAIDYVRGHKFSLVWMGHTIASLRQLRKSNVGTEVGIGIEGVDKSTARIMKEMCSGGSLSCRHAGMLRRYVQDIRSVLSETRRVLRPGGKAVFVIGNCHLRNVFIENSKAVEAIASELGMIVAAVRSRILPESRRYLPPPQSVHAGKHLRKRMREEVVITLSKCGHSTLGNSEAIGTRKLR